MAERHKIRINYKSGNTEEFWVSEFVFTESQLRKSISWKPVASPDGALVKPISIGEIEDIESIWQVESYVSDDELPTTKGHPL